MNLMLMLAMNVNTSQELGQIPVKFWAAIVQ